MAKSENQRLKILCIMQLLLAKSDEAHPVSTAEIIAHLDSWGISAERKTIYADLEALELFGLDILRRGGVDGGYYLGHRDFELPELKLLVDSVQSSKFITQKKSLELIRKIEGLASVHEAKLLHRQVFVTGRIKNMNESIYYNVDEIHSAIAADRTIRFKYIEYNIRKEKIYRHGGVLYEVSPFALTWDEENYYLVAYDSQAQIIKHYRVDKMSEIALCESPRQGEQSYKNLDIACYSKSLFGMYGGRLETVTLEFDNALVGAVIDRFGKDISIIPHGDAYFHVTVEVAVSPRFFGWLFGFGVGAHIVSPAAVVEKMKAHLSAVSNSYT